MSEKAKEASLCGQHASCDGYTSGTDNKHDQRVIIAGGVLHGCDQQLLLFEDDAIFFSRQVIDFLPLKISTRHF